LKHLLFTANLLFLLSCSTVDDKATETVSQNVPKTDVTGTLADSSYSNEYFGFQLAIPSEWRVIPEKEYKKRNKVRKNSYEHKIDNLEELAERYQKLLVLERDSTVDGLYSTILFLAEDNSETGHDPKEYFTYTSNLVNRDHPSDYPIYTFGSLKPQNTIGGLEFLAQPSKVQTSETTGRNVMTYCREFEGFLLVVQMDNIAKKEEIEVAKKLLRTIIWTEK